MFGLEKFVYLCDSKSKFINNTMKKVLSLLAVAGLFTFASCEKKTTEETTTTETTTENTDMSADTAAATVDTAATTTTTDTTVTAPAQ